MDRSLSIGLLGRGPRVGMRLVVRILRATLVTLLLIAVFELADLAAERRAESPPPFGVATQGSEPELPSAADVDLHELAVGPILTR